MNDERAKRKLSAILSADVKGYSRLMADDEEATVRTINAYREVMTSLIREHHGRTVDAKGDNVLAEFSSVVDAVRCAVQVQKDLTDKNSELPEHRKMEFRIGINLGDVIEEQGSLYGDGVNVAARLEGLAEGGGIYISGTVFDHVKNRISVGYEFQGKQSLKNIPDPARVYKVLLEPGASGKIIGEEETKPRKKKWAAILTVVVLVVAGGLLWNFHVQPDVEPASIDKMAYPLPDKPSIAILPFTNMSGDPEQDYIGDGLSENIISALSISSKIFVIARNTTFTYKGKAVDIKQVTEDLGVKYVLEGSVQKSGDRMRVTAQLIDALNGHHLWSDVYDREMKELFELQDEITKKIVLSLHVELTEGEDWRFIVKSTNNLEALKHNIKGSELHQKWNAEDMAKAREHYKAAIKLDPNYVGALVALHGTHLSDAMMGWSENPSVSFKLAFEILQKALKLNENDPFALVQLGIIFRIQGQHEKAITEIKRAITINPNFAYAHAMLAETMLYSGQFDEALALIKKGYRLDPKLYPVFLGILCKSYIYLGRYEEALEVINQMEEHTKRGAFIPKFMPPLSYSFVYQEIGREEEAHVYMTEALKLNPNLSLDFIRGNSRFINPDHIQRELDAYRKAGMPEKAPKVGP